MQPLPPRPPPLADLGAVRVRPSSSALAPSALPRSSPGAVALLHLLAGVDRVGLAVLPRSRRGSPSAAGPCPGGGGGPVPGAGVVLAVPAVLAAVAAVAPGGGAPLVVAVAAAAAAVLAKPAAVFLGRLRRLRLVLVSRSRIPASPDGSVAAGFSAGATGGSAAAAGRGPV